MGVIQSTSIKIQVLAFRAVYLKIFFPSRLVVDRWLLNIYVSVKGALGAWLGWGQSFLVLPFPLSEAQRMITLFGILTTWFPGAPQTIQLVIMVGQRQNSSFYVQGKETKSLISAELIQILLRTPSKLSLPWAGFSVLRSPKEARGLPGPPSSTDTALYHWVNSPGRPRFIFLNGLYSSKSGSEAATASALLTGWFSLLHVAK